MNWLIFFVIYILGWFMCSFSIGNILLTLFFSIPFSNKLHKLNIIADKRPIIITNILGTIVQTTIFSFVTFIVYKFASEYFAAYCVGMIIPFFALLGQCKLNENNLQDYLRSFGRFVDIEKLKEYFGNN